MPHTLTRIPVFFRPEMNANAESYSPSSGKPRAVVEDWVDLDLPIQVLSFDPATASQLAMAHDRAYVDGVLNGSIKNGFNNYSQGVAASLPFTSGAMLAAAREALRNGVVACAPVSGFHHAHWNHGAGFCTFNGLLVAAQVLHSERLVQRLGILDLDQHWGDGTEAILQQLGLGWVSHHTAGRHRYEAHDAEAYLKRLPSIVSGFMDCDLLLYQAGADAHVNDPLGGWMTDEQLLERDQIVFDVAGDLGLPIAWNLAGGYQRDKAGGIEPVLSIHRNTLRACVRACVPNSTGKDA
jgi:acetoin utilization deacetylase AcuC-like enzyme